jgi:hypothetical protein
VHAPKPSVNANATLLVSRHKKAHLRRVDQATPEPEPEPEPEYHPHPTPTPCSPTPPPHPHPYQATLVTGETLKVHTQAQSGLRWAGPELGPRASRASSERARPLRARHAQEETGTRGRPATASSPPRPPRGRPLGMLLDTAPSLPVGTLRCTPPVVPPPLVPRPWSVRRRSRRSSACSRDRGTKPSLAGSSRQANPDHSPNTQHPGPTNPNPRRSPSRTPLILMPLARTPSSAHPLALASRAGSKDAVLELLRQDPTNQVRRRG